MIERISADGTQARIDLAREVHTARGDLRDRIHLSLLRRARKVKSSIGLVDSVIGDVPGRRDWLAAREEWRIRDILAWRQNQGSDGDNSESSRQDGELPAHTEQPDVGGSVKYPGAYLPRSRRAPGGGLAPLGRLISLSPVQITHLGGADLQAIVNAADFAEATKSGAAAELARREASGDSPDGPRSSQAPSSAEEADSIIPIRWRKWALQASAPEGAEDDLPG